MNLIVRKYIDQEMAIIQAALTIIQDKTAIATTHQFADTIARDAYFTTNPTELVDSLFIGVGTGYQQYVNDAWVDKTAIVSAILTAAAIPSTGDSNVQADLDASAKQAKMFYPDNAYGGKLVTNINTITTSGFYTCYGTATGVPSATYSWYIIHINSNTGNAYGFQIAKAYGEGIGLYYRVKNSGTWSAWAMAPASQISIADVGEYFTSDNIEGALQEVGAKLADHTTQLDAIAPEYGNRFVRALAHRLKSGYYSACMTLVGDSTGDSKSEWFGLLVDWLHEKYPSHTIIYRDWDNTHSRYNLCYAPDYDGTNGIGYANLGGIAGKMLTSTDKDIYDITGDIEVGVRVNFNTLGVATTYLFSKLSGQESVRYCWYFGITNENKLRFAWSTTGSNLLYSDSTVAAGINTGEIVWLKATLDVDNGAAGNTVQFYKSTDGITWTAIGAPVVKPGTTSIYVGTGDLIIGAAYSGAYVVDAKVYSGYVKNGINGVLVADPDVSICENGRLAFADCCGNTWTILDAVKTGAPSIMLLNASMAGSSITYSTDETRFAAQLAHEPQLTFINYGHNDGSSVATYQSIYEGLCTQMLTKYPNVGIMCIAQNPKGASCTSTQRLVQAECMNQIALAAAKNNYGFVDVYRAFIQSSDLSALLESDGVHPNSAGITLWCNTIKSALAPL